MTKEEISMLSVELLTKCYAYYNRGRFWKNDFVKWLETQTKPYYNKNNELVDVAYIKHGKYGNDTEYMSSFMFDKDFVELLTTKLNK